MGSEFPCLRFDDVGYITALSRDNNMLLGIFNYTAQNRKRNEIAIIVIRASKPLISSKIILNSLRIQINSSIHLLDL